MDFPIPPLKPPYYAVTFSARLTGIDMDEYSELSNALLEKAQSLEGFLGEEALRTNERGLTISYWRDTDTIKAWMNDAEHIAARKIGKEKWYRSFVTRVAKVERDYDFTGD
ncbi:MAG: antibiotic biosynthesis monooxygenase [Kordiimonas sp.]